MRTTSVPGGTVSVEYVSMSGNRASAACTSAESMSGSGVPSSAGERRLHVGRGDALGALDAHVAQCHERRVRADPITATSASSEPTTTAHVMRRRASAS